MNVALTSYLLTLAMFIPASGRIADRFGSRTVFRAGDRVVHAGLHRLRPGTEPGVPGGGAHAAGRRRGDDVAGRAAGAAARGVQGRTGAGDGLADDPGDDRPDRRPAGRRVPGHLPVLALDLLHQRADRPGRDRAGDALHRGDARDHAQPVRPARPAAGRHRAVLPDVRPRDGQPRRRLALAHAGAGGGGRRVGRCCTRCMPGGIRGRCWISG